MQLQFVFTKRSQLFGDLMEEMGDVYGFGLSECCLSSDPKNQVD